MGLLWTRGRLNGLNHFAFCTPKSECMIYALQPNWSAWICTPIVIECRITNTNPGGVQSVALKSHQISSSAPMGHSITFGVSWICTPFPIFWLDVQGVHDLVLPSNPTNIPPSPQPTGSQPSTSSLHSTPCWKAL